MTPSEPELLAVEQCDYEAAEDLRERLSEGISEEDMAFAFAKHRSLSTRSAIAVSDEVVEAVAKAIARRRITADMSATVLAISPERLEATFNALWLDDDSETGKRQRESYRADARAALSTLGHGAPPVSGQR